MLWIGSKAAVVPIGAPQLSQKDANGELGARHEGQMISSALFSDFTLHLETKGTLVVPWRATKRSRPAQESTC